MATPDLSSLKVKFKAHAEWVLRPLPVRNPQVTTLRYRDLSLEPLFQRRGASWAALPKPWAPFGVPDGAITGCERAFLADYAALAASIATQVRGAPYDAPACIPQLVFPLLDPEKIQRDHAPTPEGVGALVLLQPWHFKKHPADISFFADGVWRVLEIDGRSHLDSEGLLRTENRNAMYKSAKALVAILTGSYDNRVLPLSQILASLGVDVRASITRS